MSDASDTTRWLEQARLRLSEVDGETRLRLRGVSPTMAVVATITVGIVVGAFLIPILAAVDNRSRPAAAALAGVYLIGLPVIAARVAARRRRMIGSGREDLIIAGDDGTIRLPWGFGRERDVVVPVARITEIVTAEEIPDRAHKMDFASERFGPHRYLKKDAHPDDELPKVSGRSTMVYAVVVCWTDDAGRPVESPIARWTSQVRVRGLTFWLRERLGIAARA